MPSRFNFGISEAAEVPGDEALDADFSKDNLMLTAAKPITAQSGEVTAADEGRVTAHCIDFERTDFKAREL